MPVPKRKFSKSRRDSKRNHWKISLRAITKCAHCGETIVPHRICSHCGYYGGVEVLPPVED